MSNETGAGVAAAMTMASRGESISSSGEAQQLAPTLAATWRARPGSVSATVSRLTWPLSLSTIAWKAPMRPAPARPTCISVAPRPSARCLIPLGTFPT